MPSEFVSIVEACKIAQMGRSVIFKRLRKGDVPGAQMISSVWTIPRAWCESVAPPEGYVTETHASKTSGVSRAAIHKAIAAGRLTALKREYIKGYRWYVNTKDLKWTLFVENKVITNRGKGE